jgi:hypothetical protein
MPIESGWDQFYCLPFWLGTLDITVLTCLADVCFKDLKDVLSAPE